MGTLGDRPGCDSAWPRVPSYPLAPPYLPQVDALGDPRQDVEPVGRGRQAGHRPRADDFLLQLILAQRESTARAQTGTGGVSVGSLWGLCEQKDEGHLPGVMGWEWRDWGRLEGLTRDWGGSLWRVGPRG